MKGKIRNALRSVLTSAQKGEEGVTLIELLAVVVILAIIAAVAVPIVLNSIKTSKINTTKQSESIIAEALNRYAANNDGNFPAATTATDLGTALTATTNGGPYLQAMPQDAWSADFKVTVTTTTYDISSTGDSETIELKNTETAPTVSP